MAAKTKCRACKKEKDSLDLCEECVKCEEGCCKCEHEDRENDCDD